MLVFNATVHPAGTKRSTPHPLPIGPTTITSVQGSTNASGSARAATYTGTFTFTDEMSEELEASSCPFNGVLIAGRKALGTAAIKAFAVLSWKQQIAALRAMKAQLPQAEQAAELWSALLSDTERNIFLMYLSQERALNSVMQINYTLTPTGNTKQEDLPFSRQTCTWSVCMFRSALTGSLCRLYDLAMAQGAVNGQNMTTAPVAWAYVIEQVFKQQVRTMLASIRLHAAA
jgi:hypothetical protein